MLGIRTSQHRHIMHFATLGAVMLLIPALAQSPAQAQGLDGGLWFGVALRACGGDAARLCVNIVPGGGRIAQCLMSQREKLSPTCLAFVDKAKSTQTAFLACAVDAQRLCGEVIPGGGRIVACLNRQHNALSSDCGHALDEVADAIKR